MTEDGESAIAGVKAALRQHQRMGDLGLRALGLLETVLATAAAMGMRIKVARDDLTLTIHIDLVAREFPQSEDESDTDQSRR